MPHDHMHIVIGSFTQFWMDTNVGLVALSGLLLPSKAKRVIYRGMSQIGNGLCSVFWSIPDVQGYLKWQEPQIVAGARCSLRETFQDAPSHLVCGPLNPQDSSAGEAPTCSLDCVCTASQGCFSTQNTQLLWAVIHVLGHDFFRIRKCHTLSSLSQSILSLADLPGTY